MNKEKIYPEDEEEVLGEEMLPEYDFRTGVRGKYAGRYAEGTNIVVLTPELARIFPDSASVNRALRVLVEAAQYSVKVVKEE